MKINFKKLLLGFAIGFVVLVLLRLTYLLVYEPYEPVQPPETYSMDTLGPESEESSFGKIRNIATNTIKQVEIAAVGTAKQITTIVQKYEKIGYIDATTTHFNQDEKKIRSVIKKYKALNQFEQNTGLKGNRVLQLAIGVDPAKFDAVVEEMKSIGKMTSFDVSTYDKTTEYQELQAKRATLEASRHALEALKQKGGNIDEFINLENRIMELDTEIQALGVNIGDYDNSGNFCTIKFTITETKADIRVPVLTQSMRAFEWSMWNYLWFVLTVLLASLAAFVILKIYESVKPSKTNDSGPEDQ